MESKAGVAVPAPIAAGSLRLPPTSSPLNNYWQLTDRLVPGRFFWRRAVLIAAFMREWLPQLPWLAQIVPWPLTRVGQVEGNRGVSKAALPALEPVEVIANAHAGGEPLRQPLCLVRLD